MRTGMWLSGIISLGVMLAAGCTLPAEPASTPRLEFEAPYAVDAEGDTHVSLGVHNAGARDFGGDERFQGQMEIREASGELRASAEIVELPTIAAGDTVWPLEWRGRLDPAAYRLTWGSDKYGFRTVEFTVVERGGRLYLAEDAPPEPTVEAPSEGERLAAQAAADLAGRLGIDADQIVVQDVTPAEFPDASLGAPEPGMTYAQVITPGYVIQLQVGDQGYEYHAAGERVVLVPGDQDTTDTVPAEGDQGPAGTVAIEGVRVTADALTVTGSSTFPDGTGIQVELLAGNQAAAWWPESAYTAVQGGAWELTVPLEGVALDRELYYTVYAWAETDDSTRVSFPFDLEGPPAAAEDWPLFTDEVYGFRLAYPQDWTTQELEAVGAGMPDDWPVQRVVIFYPQAWADRFNQSGPPDPSAPPAIPTLSLEVCVGPEEQFRRAYIEPDRSETLTIGGLQAVREQVGTGDYVSVQYVFQHPENPELRVVVIDNYSGFTDRAAEHPDLVELISAVVATFEFTP
jgi:hypothetical protein